MHHLNPLSRQVAIDRMNEKGNRREPFLFVIDFLQQHSLVLPLNEINPSLILYTTPMASNSADDCVETFSVTITPQPLTEDEYGIMFEKIISEIKRGNSFVANLTCATPIKANVTTKDIFAHANAQYKLWIKDNFVCFSPEKFIEIKDGAIITNPMKGTIDAYIPNAPDIILNSDKEKAEHNCIVDLLRNDLSRVGKNVQVSRYRYIDKIKTDKGALLQVSSEIKAELSDDYHSHLGTIIFSMLPAGSITGAPKIKTTDILLEVEQYNRGYYTGIFGLYDGNNLDSAVMIRFIEETPSGYVYKSGGGITAKSNLQEEYNEMIAKIYVPVTRNN